jgi:GMP synthase-like glutamine amidotransferase
VPVRTLCVVQHTEAEFLGLLEDQFESRSIRFHYVRPFVPGGAIPRTAEGFDGLVLLGAAPYGVVSGMLLPSLGPELRLTRDFLARRLPVIGIGAGAAILSVAAGGGAEETALEVRMSEALRERADALDGLLPAIYPLFLCARDRAVPPPDATVLARDDAGRPALFALRGNCLGFAGHPGVKSGMVADLVLAFDVMPMESGAALAALHSRQAALAEALRGMMVGLIRMTGLMHDDARAV